jgi:hypothetical protein
MNGRLGEFNTDSDLASALAALPHEPPSLDSRIRASRLEREGTPYLGRKR